MVKSQVVRVGIPVGVGWVGRSGFCLRQVVTVVSHAWGRLVFAGTRRDVEGETSEMSGRGPKWVLMVSGSPGGFVVDQQGPSLGLDHPHLEFFFGRFFPLAAAAGVGLSVSGGDLDRRRMVVAGFIVWISGIEIEGAQSG
ncbi:serine acetyltransferase 3 [Striga asiatica]|uniref:Serine acetyltransferase 3 n=1 Tax=Striga asiatica TaxID=4170 RepID=A0A5A7QUZ5_STRAF|nr:serine acetyltransferase 3 [Striga asiatica]